MGSLRRTLTAGILFTLCLPGAAAGAAGSVRPAASVAVATTAVPYQYIAKAYTELLGRAPEPAEWANAVGYFRAAGCSPASLRRFGDTVLSSTAYRDDYPPGPQTAGAIVLTLYRFVLNREPDAAGYVENRDEIASGRVSPLDAAGDLYDDRVHRAHRPGDLRSDQPELLLRRTRELDRLPGHPDAGPGHTGADGSEAVLQAALDARSAAGGGVFALPARSVTGLTTTLVVPGNVTLTTVGDPDRTGTPRWGASSGCRGSGRSPTTRAKSSSGCNRGPSWSTSGSTASATPRHRTAS